MGRMVVFLTVLQLFVFEENGTSKSAIGGMVTFGGHTYVETAPMTWHQAEAQAVALGGHLVAINSAAEQAFIVANFDLAQGQSLWMGLTDENRGNGNFGWTNGDPLTYTNWGNGEPNNIGLEHFGDLEQRGGLWNNYATQQPLRGIMEFVPVAAPSVQTLAHLSASVYSGDQPYGNYRSLGSNINVLPYQADNPSFHAVAYAQTPDTTQIVVAIRGTDLNGERIAAKNLIDDSSFVTNTPTHFMAKDVAYAADFVKSLHETYPEATITLTGHSLGGAIAQLVGEASGLTTTTFNSPGTAALFNQLTTELSPVSGISSGGPQTNYRIYGDQVSLAGTQAGATVILPAPPGTHFASNTGTLGDLLKNFDLYFHTLHSMDTVIGELSQPQIFQLGPNDVGTIQSAIHPLSISTLNLQQNLLAFGFDVLDRLPVLVDPVGANDFVFISDPGSPLFLGIDLPAANGIFSYEIRWEVAGQWSVFQDVVPGNEFIFGGGVDEIEVLPLDKSGGNIALPDGFLFDVTFSSTGRFEGTMIETRTVPEPQSLVTVGIGALLAVCIGMLRRNRWTS